MAYHSGFGVPSWGLVPVLDVVQLMVEIAMLTLFYCTMPSWILTYAAIEVWEIDFLFVSLVAARIVYKLCVH